jgi:6-methylsalicylate decarboxylase
MSFTIDVHHHILLEVFWRAANDAHDPVGGKTPVARRKAEFVLSAGEQAQLISFARSGSVMTRGPSSHGFRRRGFQK